MLSNLLEFLVKKNAKVEIFAEASNLGQDQYLYKAFVRLIQLGIRKKNISHQLSKKIFTSLCFVTKLNYDAGTQLADLFGFFGKLKIMEKESKNLDYFEKLILKIGKQKLLQFKILP